MRRCLVVLAVVVWSCGVGIVHFLKAVVRLLIMPFIRRTRTRLVKTSCEDAWLCWLWLCGAVV
jgi:H+/Cl- antiporter ClcA